MKIAYLTHMRLPTKKAYGIQMVHTCKALTEFGADVTIFLADNKTKEVSLFDFYKIPKAFSLKQVFSINFFRNTRLGFWIHMLSYSSGVLWEIAGRGYSVVYSREPFPLLFLTFSNIKTVYEMHDFPERYHWLNKFLCQRVSVLVVTNVWAREQCIKKYGISKYKIILAPNGYDEESFNNPLSKIDARINLNIGIGSKVVVYTGNLYRWKGVETIIAAAKKLSEIEFIIVGGNEDDIFKIKNETSPSSNVFFTGHKPQYSIPSYLYAADLLVLPNIPITQHSEFSTSPIKLFEYMASKRSVLASRLPSIENIVNDEDVFFAESGNIQDWVIKIRDFFLLDSESINKKLINSEKKVAQYTWTKKAEKIISNI